MDWFEEPVEPRIEKVVDMCLALNEAFSTDLGPYSTLIELAEIMPDWDSKETFIKALYGKRIHSEV